MLVMLIGASGAVGRALVPKLVAAGHEVVATARRAPEDVPAGVTTRELDLLDRSAVVKAVAEIQPEAVIHQATALTGLGNNLRRFDREFTITNRLRTDGTATLIAAISGLGRPSRLVVQSFCGWPWMPTGGPVKTETDDIDPSPAPAFRRTIAALVEQERLVVRHPDAVALRYGALYGPGTSLTNGGAQIEAIRTRTFPKVGDAGAVWSFLHVDDAADAALAALTRGDGIYNVVDDHPTPVGEWLEQVARMIGAGKPRRIPIWLARAVGGQGLVHMMTSARGSSNARACRDLGWRPAHPHWRAGFAEDLQHTVPSGTG